MIVVCCFFCVCESKGCNSKLTFSPFSLALEQLGLFFVFLCESQNASLFYMSDPDAVLKGCIFLLGGNLRFNGKERTRRIYPRADEALSSCKRLHSDSNYQQKN